MKYYSIRVVNADNKDEAIEQVEQGEFDESDPLCDEVLTEEELILRLQINKEQSYIVQYSIRDGENEYSKYVEIVGSEANIGGKIDEYFRDFFGEGSYKDIDNNVYWSGDGCQAVEVETYQPVKDEDMKVIKQYLTL